jgi:hypothetical protein
MYAPPIGHKSWLTYVLDVAKVPGVITAEAAIPAPWIKERAKDEARAADKQIASLKVRLRILETDPQGYCQQFLRNSQ